MIVAVMVWLALVPAASAAQRRPGFYHLGVGSGPAVTDGKRYVAFPLDDSSVAFYDFGVRSPSERVLRAPPCVDSGGYSYPSLLDGVGDGEVLWYCEIFLEGPLLEDVDTGHVAHIPLPPPSLIGESGGGFGGAVGSSWIREWMEDHGLSYPAYYKRATGAWRPEPKSARRYADLDDPALAHTLCRPLRRSLRPSQESDQIAVAYEPYFFERPYGVTTEARDNGIAHERITVERCGSHKRSIIGRCPLFCADVQFSAGLVTWANGPGLRAYAPRTGARYTWPPSAIPSSDPSARWFGHTRQRLIVSAPSLADIRKWDIFAARMPKG